MNKYINRKAHKKGLYLKNINIKGEIKIYYLIDMYSSKIISKGTEEELVKAIEVYKR